MGWSFRKSIRIAPGLRLNLSKSGVGVSGGVKGMRLSVGPSGTQVTAGSHGMYYRKRFGRGRAPQGADAGLWPVMDQRPLFARILAALLKLTLILLFFLFVIAAIWLWYALH